MSGNDTEGQPKKPELKVNKQGEINLKGKELVEAIIGDHKVTIFGENHSHHRSDYWRGQPGFSEALKNSGVTIVFPEFSQRELDVVHSAMEEYTRLGAGIKPKRVDLLRANNNINFSLLEEDEKFAVAMKMANTYDVVESGQERMRDLSFSAFGSVHIKDQAERHISSKYIMFEHLNYMYDGIKVIASDTDQKYERTYSEILADSLEKENATLDKLAQQKIKEKQALLKKIDLNDFNQALELFKKRSEQGLVESVIEDNNSRIDTLRTKGKEDDILVRREEINSYVRDHVILNTSDTDKVVLTWGMLHMYNDTAISVEQGDDLDEMLEKYYGKDSVVTIALFGTRESYAEFEQRVMGGKIKDCPDYCIIAGELQKFNDGHPDYKRDFEFGQETAYSMPERIAYLKAQQEKLKEKQEREKAKPSKGGPNMGEILEQFDSIEIDHNFTTGAINAKLQRQRG